MLWLSILNYTAFHVKNIYFSLYFYEFTLLKSQIKNIQYLYTHPYNLYRLYSDVVMEEMKIINDSAASPILSDASSGYPATNSKLSFNNGNTSQ